MPPLFLCAKHLLNWGTAWQPVSLKGLPRPCDTGCQPVNPTQDFILAPASVHPWQIPSLQPKLSGIPMSDDFKPMRRHLPVETRQRNLPHWEQEGCTYFITWRMADSIPEDALGPWRQEREAFFRVHPKPWDDITQRDYHARFTRRIEQWLDAGHGSCALKSPLFRDPVRESLHHFHQTRYTLSAWVIMPNHVHVLVRPLPAWPLSSLLHTWKSFTASRVNKLQGSKGTFWMDESFDHIVRTEIQLAHFRRYIEENPSKAKLRPEEYSLWMGAGEEK